MKRFSIISIYILAVAGLLLVTLPVPWFPSFIDVRYTGWSELLSAAIVYFLPFLFRASPKSPDAEKKNRATDILQFMAAVAVFADFLGAVGLYELYQIGIPYNYFLHFCVPVFATVMLSIFIERRYFVRPRYAIVWAFLTVILSSVIWEVIENSADFFFGTHLAGPDQSSAVNVTLADFYFDAAGAALGAIIMFFRSRRKNTAD